MNQLVHFFLSQGFNASDASKMAARFQREAFKKGDLLAEEGKICRHLGFIESGFVHYFILMNGEEKTTYATHSHNFVTSLVSFLKETPARESIRAVTDTIVWWIPKNDLQELQKEVATFTDFYVGILEWQICCIDESRLDSILLTAAERYEKMIAKEPKLLREIPLQYLASILGVTPRHLSRIRANVK